ncbi:hypothetical protein ACFC0C_11765 [Streptomyces sp. NPDC056178]|uniref:hypothetical protein n=1 Tax=unclassified Streptomyces TaxID=2593676 RepID=UPI0035DB3C5F
MGEAVTEPGDLMQWAARRQFHHRSALMQAWGAVLLVVACVLWIRLGFMLAEQWDAYCYRVSQCEAVTEVPKQLTVLGISALLSVLGTALLVAGSVRRQTSAHVFEVIEMQKSEERERAKQQK